MPPPVIPGPSTNPMNFTENQQANAVLERLRQQRETGRFCDVVLIVQDRQFPAHRNVLAACSPYFDSILKMHKVVKEQVTVHCQYADVFEVLLHYMYSGNVVIDRENVTELLKLSHNLLVSKLKNYCAEYLDRYLDAANCITVKELGEKYNMPGLVKNASLYMELNIDYVLAESSDVLEYSPEAAEAILSDTKFQISPDAQLRYVIRWVSFNLAEREQNLAHLFNLVNFRSISESFLIQKIEADPLFERSENALYTLLKHCHDLQRLPSKLNAIYHGLVVKRSGDVSIFLNATSLPNGNNLDLAEIFENPEHEENNENLAEKENSVPKTANEAEENHSEKNLGSMTKPESNLPPPSDSESSPMPAPGGSDGDESTASERSHTNFANLKVQPLKIKLKLSEAANKPKILGYKHTLYKKHSILNTLGARRRGRKKMNPERISTIDSTVDDVVELAASGGIDLTGGATSDVGDDVFANLVEDPDELPFDENSDDDDEIEPGDGHLVVDEGGDSSLPKAEVLFKCPHCVYTSNCQSRIQSHIDKAHTKNRVYNCNMCGFKCNWNREFYSHMKEHFQGPPFKCDICEYEGERIQQLLNHRMKHTDEKPFGCQECDYRCRTKTNLMAHMRSHTGDKPFRCPECGRGFSIKSTLDQHLATHSDARPFKCEHCEFSTKYQSHLISHKRIHTGDVFRCQYPDCEYTSPKKSQLAAHMRTHLAVRCHECKVCGRSFIEKSHLVRHERIHLTIKPFKCEHCEYASSRRDKLKEHIQKHHSGSAPGKRGFRKRALRGLGRKIIGDASRLLAKLQRAPSIDEGHLMGANNEDSFGDASGVYGMEMDSVGVHRQLDFNSMIGGPDTASTSAFNPQHFMHTSANFRIQSPALSLDAALAQQSPTRGDVMLSSHAASSAPTPTAALLGGIPDSPQSMSNSFLSDPVAGGTTTPTGDPLQRPMSLPSLGQGAWGSQSSGDFGSLNSFMAMF